MGLVIVCQYLHDFYIAHKYQLFLCLILLFWSLIFVIENMTCISVLSLALTLFIFPFYLFFKHWIISPLHKNAGESPLRRESLRFSCLHELSHVIRFDTGQLFLPVLFHSLEALSIPLFCLIWIDSLCYCWFRNLVWGFSRQIRLLNDRFSFLLKKWVELDTGR